MSRQRWEAERYAEHGRFVAELAGPVLELLAPVAGERVLDLGCGDGELAIQLVARGCEVVAVDAAPGMVERARARGLDARIADGHELPFQGEFDAVLSNAALHWMKRDPDAVLAGVARALRPGGRFIGEMGGHGNVAAITVAIAAVLARRGLDGTVAAFPWYFPTVPAYRRRLEAQGFTVDTIALLPRPTLLPTGMEGWLRTFADWLPEAGREAVLEEVIGLLRPVLCDEDGTWTADYVRLRFKAHRP